MEANFVKNTLRITDLDNNGKGEVWLMYRTVCHGDVSPSNLKVIMYQEQQKFAMRGTSKVRVSDNRFDGGDYKFDRAFMAAPQIFRDFAQKLWAEKVIQTWDN